MASDWEARIEEMVREARSDPRTIHELITEALTEPDEDAAWESVSILHRRGTRDVVDAARALCFSECAVERTLGANILGQVGVPYRSYPDEAVAVILRMLRSETDGDVLYAACIALGHNREPASIPTLVRLAPHPNARIRFAVAFALLFDDPVAIATLIHLTHDTDSVVRDWATFALGTQLDIDTPDVRNALLGRVIDADEVVRGEALVGLARRRDERGIAPLVRELDGYATSVNDSYAIEAAERFADPRLLAVLTRLAATADGEDGRFDEAIHQCTAAEK